MWNYFFPGPLTTKSSADCVIDLYYRPGYRYVRSVYAISSGSKFFRYVGDVCIGQIYIRPFIASTNMQFECGNLRWRQTT
jgi:hypothetical protein